MTEPKGNALLIDSDMFR